MPSPKEVAAWIFQAVPEDYNLRQALADLDEDVWVARQRRKDMAPGQRVYIWLARPGEGVVAVGQIASIVESAPAPGWQLPYRQPSVRVAASQPEPRVRVRYSAKFLHAPLSRSFLASDPILARQPPIGPVYVGTNFAVGSDAEERLQAIMKGAALKTRHSAAAPAITRVAAKRPLRIATWNINSVRLRRPLLKDLVAALQPDVLCLQETKCPDEHFPLEELQAFGFAHVAHRGMKGYNGVAVLSRLPFAVRGGDPDWCGKGDCRHLAVELDAPGGPIELHDFYVPAGGDVPDRDANAKFAHKLDFLAEAAAWCAARGEARRAVLVGDLNVAPLEHDVWSHRQMLDVVSHTPVEVEALAAWRRAGAWHDAVRHFVPEDQKLYTWWSYRARDWEASDRGRRLDHVWVSQDLAGALSRHAVLKPARGWPQASDHVPVMVEIAP